MVHTVRLGEKLCANDDEVHRHAGHKNHRLQDLDTRSRCGPSGLEVTRPAVAKVHGYMASPAHGSHHGSHATDHGLRPLQARSIRPSSPSPPAVAHRRGVDISSTGAARCATAASSGRPPPAGELAPMACAPTALRAPPTRDDRGASPPPRRAWPSSVGCTQRAAAARGCAAASVDGTRWLSSRSSTGDPIQGRRACLNTASPGWPAPSPGGAKGCAASVAGAPFAGTPAPGPGHSSAVAQEDRRPTNAHTIATRGMATGLLGCEFLDRRLFMEPDTPCPACLAR